MKRLIVYVAGLNEDRNNICDLYEKLQSEPSFGTRDDTELFKYPEIMRLGTRGKMADHCGELNHRIQEYWGDSQQRANEIILIGHSVGGVMLRYAYLKALRGDREERHEWAQHVTRIVLLAAPNAGFELDFIGGLWRKNFAKVISRFPLRLACLDVLAGSAFISDLRIRWIEVMHSLHDTAPLVVQVLGRDDEYVTPEHSRDMQVCRNGAQILLPGAKHEDIVKIKDVYEDKPGQRYRSLYRAILGEVEPADFEPEAIDPQEASKTAIVFTLHGIRSGATDWPELLGKQYREETQNASNALHFVTPSYDYMSAFNFAFTLRRRENLRWFAKEYTYYLARHPGKPFYFVGHSNGTYLFGQSMERISGMRFDRVFLAGSVLPHKLEWRGFVDDGRIETIASVCANKDVPVALLCSTLRGFGMCDVGVGGFRSFLNFPDYPVGHQATWIEGGHGAALGTSDGREKVIKFLDGGSPQFDDNAKPSWWFTMLSRAMPFIAWGALIGAIWAVTEYVHSVSATVSLIVVLLLIYVGLKIG
jgi:hypothetical protein